MQYNTSMYCSSQITRTAVSAARHLPLVHHNKTDNHRKADFCFLGNVASPKYLSRSQMLQQQSILFRSSAHLGIIDPVRHGRHREEQAGVTHETRRTETTCIGFRAPNSAPVSWHRCGSRCHIKLYCLCFSWRQVSSLPGRWQEYILKPQGHWSCSASANLHEATVQLHIFIGESEQ